MFNGKGVCSCVAHVLLEPSCVGFWQPECVMVAPTSMHHCSMPPPTPLRFPSHAMPPFSIQLPLPVPFPVAPSFPRGGYHILHHTLLHTSPFSVPLRTSSFSVPLRASPFSVYIECSPSHPAPHLSVLHPPPHLFVFRSPPRLSVFRLHRRIAILCLPHAYAFSVPFRASPFSVYIDASPFHASPTPLRFPSHAMPPFSDQHPFPVPFPVTRSVPCRTFRSLSRVPFPVARSVPYAPSGPLSPSRFHKGATAFSVPCHASVFCPTPRPRSIPCRPLVSMRGPSRSPSHPTPHLSIFRPPPHLFVFRPSPRPSILCLHQRIAIPCFPHAFFRPMPCLRFPSNTPSPFRSLSLPCFHKGAITPHSTPLK